MISAFIGVLLLNNPFTNSNNQEELEEDIINDEYATLKGTLWAILGSSAAATAYLCMRIMKDGIHYSVAPFYFSAGSVFLAPISIPITNPGGINFSGYDKETIIFMLLIGFFTFIA